MISTIIRVYLYMQCKVTFQQLWILILVLLILSCTFSVYSVI